MDPLDWPDYKNKANLIDELPYLILWPACMYVVESLYLLSPIVSIVCCSVYSCSVYGTGIIMQREFVRGLSTNRVAALTNNSNQKPTELLTTRVVARLDDRGLLQLPCHVQNWFVALFSVYCVLSNEINMSCLELNLNYATVITWSL